MENDGEVRPSVVESRGRWLIAAVPETDAERSSNKKHIPPDVLAGRMCFFAVLYSAA